LSRRRDDGAAEPGGAVIPLRPRRDRPRPTSLFDAPSATLIAADLPPAPLPPAAARGPTDTLAEEALPLDEGPYLEDLFEEIVRQPRDLWPALIERRCRGDVALAMELRALLSAHGVGGAEVLRPGDRVGRYTLERELGCGSTAGVWQAVDNRLARSVALKIFHHSGSTGLGLRQALEEAQASSDVVSDFVIRVQDVSTEQSQGPSYIDMELCAEYPEGGGALQVGFAASATEPRGVEEVIRWVMEAARGVQAAHLQGVFHRDLKPDNVMVRPVSRRAQVTDFGLAVNGLDPSHGMDARGERTVTISRGGGRLRVAGTPIFMAPESAAGLPVHLDPVRDEDRRTLVGLDVYGLGATLYTLLAGRPPYSAGPDSPDPVNDVLRQVRAGPPAPLGERRTDFPVSARLERVVARAMARDPEARYPSAGALADDLEHLLSYRPSSQDAGRPALRASLWVRRHWRTVSAALAVAVMLISGVITSQIVEDARLSIAESHAEAAQARVEAARSRSEARDALEDALTARGEAELARTEKAEADRLRMLSRAEADQELLQARNELSQARGQAAVTAQSLAKETEQRQSVQSDLEAERAALEELVERLAREIEAHDQTTSELRRANVDRQALAADLAAEREARAVSDARSAYDLARLKAAEAALAREVAAHEATEALLNELLALNPDGLTPATVAGSAAEGAPLAGAPPTGAPLTDTAPTGAGATGTPQRAAPAEPAPARTAPPPRTEPAPREDEVQTDAMDEGPWSSPEPAAPAGGEIINL
jgi:serine/threonine protein kinase